MTHADLVRLLETMRDVIWTEGEYKLSQHDVNAAISALNSGEVVLVPGEPTGEMWAAGRAEFVTRSNAFQEANSLDKAMIVADGSPACIYRAMLAAKGK